MLNGNTLGENKILKPLLSRNVHAVSLSSIQKKLLAFRMVYFFFEDPVYSHNSLETSLLSLMSFKCYSIWKNWHIVQLNENKWINTCAKIVWGILTHGKVYSKCRYEYRAMHIDAFLGGSGLVTDNPNDKMVNYKKKILGHNNARHYPRLLKTAI